MWRLQADRDSHERPDQDWTEMEIRQWRACFGTRLSLLYNPTAYLSKRSRSFHSSLSRLSRYFSQIQPAISYQPLSPLESTIHNTAAHCTMFNSSVASSSRHSIDVFWQMPPDKYPFPMSDLRSADLRCFRTTVLPTTPPARRSTASAESVYLDPSPSKYSSAVTLRTQIRPGVWSDGNDRVLSAACPTVQAFLACARHDMNLPVAPSELVFALAALEVFYSIDDPVHWMFWSDEKKNQTAEVVSRISRESISSSALQSPYFCLFKLSTSAAAHSISCCLEWDPRISLHTIWPPWADILASLRA